MGLTIPLLGQDGNPTQWEFPSYDVRIPPSSQRSFDYMGRFILFNLFSLFSQEPLLYFYPTRGMTMILNVNSIAPEYAIQEQIVISSDMYSLGSLIYAVHAKVSVGQPYAGKFFFHSCER